MMVDTDDFATITADLMKGACELLQTDLAVTREDYILRNMAGPGYAIPSEEGNAAVQIMAEKEGLFLDPVYTGKAFAGLIALAKEGAFGKDDNVLFIHTGGAGGLFAIDM